MINHRTLCWIKVTPGFAKLRCAVAVWPVEMDPVPRWCLATRIWRVSSRLHKCEPEVCRTPLREIRSTVERPWNVALSGVCLSRTSSTRSAAASPACTKHFNPQYGDVGIRHSSNHSAVTFADVGDRHEMKVFNVGQRAVANGLTAASVVQIPSSDGICECGHF